MFYWLFGEVPTSVRVTGIQAGKVECSSNPNVAVVTCEYASPMIATMHLDYVALPQRHEYEIMGDQGWAVLSLSDGTMAVGRRDNAEVRRESLPVAMEGVYRAEHSAFSRRWMGCVCPRVRPRMRWLQRRSVKQLWSPGRRVSRLPWLSGGLLRELLAPDSNRVFEWCRVSNVMLTFGFGVGLVSVSREHQRD